MVGLYLNPPENAVVLCVDEKSQIQALNPTRRCCRCRLERREQGGGAVALVVVGGARAGNPGLATLGWVHWHNTSRLHGYLGDIPPAEYEQAFYAAHRTDQPPVGIPS